MSEASKEFQEYLRNDWPHELKVVREFLKDGANVNSVDEEGNSPLLLELRSSFDSSEMLEFISKKGADLRHKNLRGQTALMLAVLRPSLDDFSARLIKDGVEVDATDSDGNSAIHYAYGNKTILSLLTKAGVSLNQLNKKNQTLLHVPSGVYQSIGFDGRPHYGGIETTTLKWLLKQGLDPNARDSNGCTPLHAVSRINKDSPVKAATVLVEAGGDPSVLDETGTPFSVFHLHDGDPSLAKWFAAKGSHPFDAIIAGDLNQFERHFISEKSVSVRCGKTSPLHVAAMTGSSKEIIEQLIRRTKDLDEHDSRGESALELAFKNTMGDAAVALIRAGARIENRKSVNKHDQPDDPSRSWLASAAQMGNLELFSLIEPAAKPEERHALLTKVKLTPPVLLAVSKHFMASGVPHEYFDYSRYIEAAEGRENSIKVLLLQDMLELMRKGKGPLHQSDNSKLYYGLARNKNTEVSRLAYMLLVESLECRLKSEQNEFVKKWASDISSKDKLFCEMINAGDFPNLAQEIVNQRSKTEDETSEISNFDDPVALIKIAAEAARHGKLELLVKLIEKGLSLNALNDGLAIFQTLIVNHTTIKNLEWAKQQGADLTLSDSEGRSLLHHLVSSWKFNEDVFNKLLKLGLDINSRDRNGFTPFHLCLDNKDKREKLVELGADPRVADKPGITTLITSAMNRDPECMQFLLAAGVSPTDRDSRGNTALGYIFNLDKKSKECIRLLVDAGLHPDDAGEKKHLNTALVADDVPFAIWLLERQAKISNCDLADKKVLAAVSKIIRSRPELIASQLDSLDDEHRSLLQLLLSKSINAPAEADHNELPELLREGGWPIAVTSRSLVVANKVVLPERNATLVWKGNEEKTILSSRRVKHDADSDKKFEDVISRFEKKPGTIKLGSLTNASDALFIKYWNESSVALNQYVQVAGGGWWASKVMTGFRAEDLRYLLARYGLAVLPGILNLASKKPGPVMKALGNFDAPSCALQVAKFMTGSTSRLARRWLMTYPETAIHGLISPAVGKPGKDRDAAEAALRYLASQGHRDAIEKLAEHAGTEVTASIREILSVDPRSDYMPKKFPALPSFWDAGIHPRPLLRNGGKALSLSAIETLVRMISISTYDARTPALDDVIDACEPVSLADFAWSVFDEWRAKGDSASNWMFQALAYLSDDRYAKKLTPIIRDWPASNGQAKALMGLDILAAIGTDVALAQIQSIARKNKYKPIVARADEMLMAIAEARELTAEQFEDRLVPTLGLDENGAIVIDYGKHRFTGCVDETLKPRLCDETGATLKELPKPGKDDDKALANQAGEDWAEFKTELKPVASLQLLRLENAMIDARRWTGDEFLSLVAGHPLLQQPARSLVWGLFNEKGKLLRSFRIRSDGTAEDLKGKPVEIEAASLVGIPHPIVLGEDVAAWKEVFAHAKQGQAFAQLVRKTHLRQDDAEMDLFGLQGAKIHAKSLKSLKSMGWEISMAGIADVIDCYYRSFPSCEVQLKVEPGVGLTDLETLSSEQTLDLDVPKILSEIEFSELMRELHTLKK